MQTNKSKLRKIMKEFHTSFLHIALFSMFVNFSMLAMPAYMMSVFDRVLNSGSVDTLILLTLILVLIFVSMWLLELVRARMMIRVAARFDQRIREHIFNGMFLSSLQTGSRSPQALSDLNAVQQFMTSKAIFAFFDFPWLPVFIGVLFLMHPWYGWMAVFSSIIMIFMTIISDLKTKKPLIDAMKHNGESSRIVHDQLSNADVVHALGMQKVMAKRWLKFHNKSHFSQSQSKDSEALLTNASKTLRILLQSLVMGLGALLVIMGEASAGTMIAASFILGRALQPLDMFMGMWQSFTPAKKSWHDLNTLLENFPEEDERMSLPAPKGNLSIQQLFAGPPNRDSTLQDISFSLNTGEIMMLAGPSGSGKSTLARVILGIWSPSSGTVRLDGADVSKWPRHELGSYLGYLPQDIELFSGTVAENIARFEHIDSEKVVAAAKLADIHDLLLSLPEGYDTQVGAGGMTLSGGQRQRLGLARAVYNNPIFVLLDEPNSNLDDAGEQALLKTVQKLKQQGTTVILISHKMNILNYADKVLILQAGKISFFGSRNAMIQKLQLEKQKAANLTAAANTNSPQKNSGEDV